jgi:hypothetical protein
MLASSAICSTASRAVTVSYGHEASGGELDSALLPCDA